MVETGSGNSCDSSKDRQPRHLESDQGRKRRNVRSKEKAREGRAKAGREEPGKPNSRALGEFQRVLRL